MNSLPTEACVERDRLLRRARILIAVFIFGLFVSGVTAFPLQSELRFAVRLCDRSAHAPAPVAAWLHRVYAALVDENARYPFLAYGTDWLAFAHLVIAAAFIGPWRDPARNRWVLTWGLVACAAVPLLAFIAGPLRGIPLYWRLIDSSFGLFGALILWPAWRIAGRLQRDM